MTENHRKHTAKISNLQLEIFLNILQLLKNIIYFITGKFAEKFLSQVDSSMKNFSVGTGRKLNVHKTFRRRRGRLLNVSCTFNLRPMSTEFWQQNFFRLDDWNQNFFTQLKNNWLFKSWKSILSMRVIYCKLLSEAATRRVL